MGGVNNLAPLMQMRRRPKCGGESRRRGVHSSPSDKWGGGREEPKDNNASREQRQKTGIYHPLGDESGFYQVAVFCRDTETKPRLMLTMATEPCGAAD